MCSIKRKDLDGELVERINELETLIKKNKILYYQGGKAIPDYEYDKLENELKKIDENNPVLQLVGSLRGKGQKIKHETKMLSLNKTYSLEELKKWTNGFEVVSTKKIDGVSCSLIYRNGKLELGKTRGDGSFGEDITSKVMWMESVPKEISEVNREILEVRGEMYCTEDNFFHLSEEMVSVGQEKPTSQRNIVAGLMGRKENLEFCRYITFKGFDYLGEEEELKTEVEKFEKLKKLGFDIPEYTHHKDCGKLEKIIEDVRVFMAEGDFQIDGIVFSFNDLKMHLEMGETAHHPRYKMAFKYKGEAKQTVLKEIVWSVSRNGILTPIGNVEPVYLSGAKISKVTLHNYGLVKLHNLKKGDVIEIIRSGEVIPKFMEVKESSDQVFEIPTFCPVCNSDVVIDDIRLRCSNENCPGKIKEVILNFVQKIGIEDLSSKRLDEMIRVELVRNISDIYKVSKDDLLKLDKTKDKLANKLFDSIQNSKNGTLTTFLSALGISGGAYNKCEKVVSSGFDTIGKIKELTVEKLMTVDSFAEKSATEFYKSLKEKITLIDELSTLGFCFEHQEIKEEGVFSGKKICITGSLSEKRAVIEGKIRDSGGIIVSSVTKNTDLLLTNETDSKSSKFKKAKQLDVEIISESELLEKL